MPTLPLMNWERWLITLWPIMSDYFTAVHTHSSIEFRPCQTAIAMPSGVLAASSIALSAGTFVFSLSLRISFRRSDIHYSNRFPRIENDRRVDITQTWQFPFLATQFNTKPVITVSRFSLPMSVASIYHLTVQLKLSFRVQFNITLSDVNFIKNDASLGLASRSAFPLHSVNWTISAGLACQMYNV